MKDLYNLMIALADSAKLNDSNIKIFDLKTDEGLKGYNEQLDTLENCGLDLLQAFGIDSKKWITNMRNIGQKIHDANKKENKETPKQIDRKVKDHTFKDDEDLLDFDDTPEEKTPKFVRPSEALNVNQKLQLHKIVQEYVDTMIKPYNKNMLSTKQINDAYAGLYEFAAWIMNK